jgi:hypothetical protein
MRLSYFLAALVLCLVGVRSSAVAQRQPTVEAEITRLEQLEGQSVMKGDTTTLFKLWTKDFVVNNPDNQVVTAQQVRAFIRLGKIDYNSFQRIIEKITVVDNVAIAMGHEITTPQQQTSNAGKTVTRRYTDVWVRQAGAWHLAARQATNILVQ